MRKPTLHLEHFPCCWVSRKRSAAAFSLRKTPIDVDALGYTYREKCSKALPWNRSFHGPEGPCSLHPAFSSRRFACLARAFIAGVPSRRARSIISSAIARSDRSSSASNPIPSTAEQRVTLLSSSKSSSISLAARSLCSRVCAVRATTRPRCHRVLDSSIGTSASSPASSSANGHSALASFSVTRRATSAARFRSSTSPNIAPTSNRNARRSASIARAVARARSSPHRPASRFSSRGAVNFLRALTISATCVDAAKTFHPPKAHRSPAPPLHSAADTPSVGHDDAPSASTCHSKY